MPGPNPPYPYPTLYPENQQQSRTLIQTALRERVYAAVYQTSTQRCASLPVWLHCYNWHRPHSSFEKQTPIGRLEVDGNNLMNFHS